MYPIVLAHGFFGFRKLIGIEYFKGVKKFLTRKFPDLKVKVTEVAPNDLVNKRAVQLWSQIDEMDNKVHIIGHSMGGLDSRFLLSPNGLNKSEKVVSLTTIATPHCGSPVADFIINQREKLTSQEYDQFNRIIPTVNRTTKKIVKSLKLKVDVWKYLLELFNFSDRAMTNLTTSYLKQFNTKHPNAPNVKYFSYSGATGPAEQDYLPPIMYLTWAIIFLSRKKSAGGRNDGIVAVDSARWGEYKGEIPADHFKQVGHDLSGMACLRKLFPCLRPLNHKKFFEKIVLDLQSLEKNSRT
jgi:triacylglycerol lipase